MTGLVEKQVAVGIVCLDVRKAFDTISINIPLESSDEWHEIWLEAS